jgi:hypothetical protein
MGGKTQDTSATRSMSFTSQLQKLCTSDPHSGHVIHQETMKIEIIFTTVRNLFHTLIIKFNKLPSPITSSLSPTSDIQLSIQEREASWN